MVASNSGGEDTDADAGDGAERFATRKKGGASSENVVDKKDVFACKGMRGRVLRRGVQRVILRFGRDGMHGGKVCSEHFEGSGSVCFRGYAGDGERKNVFYVFVAQEFVCLRLLFVSLAAPYTFRVNGDVRNFADAFGDAFTLVVSTL